MGVSRSWISCLIFHFLVIYADSSPVGENSQNLIKLKVVCSSRWAFKPAYQACQAYLRKSLHVLPYIAKRSDGSAVCEDFEAFKWTYKFHDCFIDRKYTDGGRELNSIVDRILDHGEACIEMSSRECRPDFRGFISLMNKTITQMKDYAEMYLEEIHKGRENIKDLQCVETSLNIKTYEECFHEIVPQGTNLTEEHFQKTVQVGIFCANRGNSGCSKEAKTSLNRIVRIILGVEQPNVEEFEEVPTTEAPTTEAPTTEAPTTEAPTTEAPETEAAEIEVEQSYEKEDFEPEIKPTEAPWMWYDYLAYPFVQAWKWVSGLFG